MCSCNQEVLILMITTLRIIVSVRIVKLTVPEVVQSGSAGALLECHYFVDGASDALTVQWLFNRRDVIYEWSPGSRPKAPAHLGGIMNLRQDVGLEIAAAENYLPLHLVNLVPQQTGEYTCIVNVNGTEVQETKPMLVFSSEEEFELKIEQDHNGTEVKCYTRGLYPHPELTIELAGEAVPRQRQRVWREGELFAAESAAALPNARAAGAVTCRLQLVPAGYTAIKRANQLTEGTHQSNGSSSLSNFFNTIILLRVLTTTVRYICV